MGSLKKRAVLLTILAVLILAGITGTLMLSSSYETDEEAVNAFLPPDSTYLEEDGMKLTQTTSLYNYSVTTDIDYEFLKKFIDGDDTVYVVKFSKIRQKNSEGKSSTSTVDDDIGLYFRLNDSSKELSFQMSENTISCKRSD